MHQRCELGLKRSFYPLELRLSENILKRLQLRLKNQID